MTKARSGVLLFSCLLLFIALFISGCRPRQSGNEKRYPIKGKVIEVNLTDRTATIAHEDIEGYMPGMTMPFKIKSDADLAMLKGGDQITGNLVVDGLSSWIEITAIVESAQTP